MTVPLLVRGVFPISLETGYVSGTEKSTRANGKKNARPDLIVHFWGSVCWAILSETNAWVFSRFEKISWLLQKVHL